MLCPFCQHNIPARSAEFCPSCGFRVQETDLGFLEGLRSFTDRRYADALKRWELALLGAPGNPALLRAIGHAQLHAGSHSGALESYQQATAAGDKSADLHFNVALIHLQSKDLAEAEEELNLTLNAPASLKSGHFYLGLFFDSEHAFRCEAALRLAKLQRERGDLAAAARSYERALEYDPSSISALQNLAELNLLEKKHRIAIERLERVLQLSPLEEERINAHNNLAVALYEQEEIDQAISHLKKVLELEPGNPTAIHNLNHIYEQEGYFRESPAIPHAMRFVDIVDFGSPIFGLEGSEDSADRHEPTIVGTSQDMLRVMRLARVAATSDSNALLLGESGTGKELLAQVIHQNSPRKNGPFMVVHCSSLTELQLESELFGHEKGAFTGAHQRRVGRLEAADGGTVFLDEVADLTPILQVRLLRFLRDREFAPIGGARSRAADVRLIVATSRPIEQMVADRQFREDLFYLLNVVRIDCPPLRDRGEDIPLLVDYFLRKHARRAGQKRAPLKLSREELGVLLEYSWPGNVRELESFIERAVIVGKQSGAFAEDIKRMRQGRHRAGTDTADEPITADSQLRHPVNLTLEELERRHILAVLEATGHNQRAASRILGINPSTLWRKLRSYGLSLAEEPTQDDGPEEKKPRKRRA